MSGESPSQGIKLAFLTYVQEQPNGSGRGALLVTDEATRPLEFRCTTPIQPNPLQRMLYGQTLRSYIAADLVGIPLFRALQEKPSMILVTDPLFLKMRPSVDIAMLCIRRQGEQISRVIAEDHGSGGEPALLSCASGRFQPLTVTGSFEHGQELDLTIETLRPIFSGMDLLEPFDRIEKVIAELDRQESGVAEKPKPK